MAKLLLGDQAFEVELLTDVPTNWPGIKVMSKGAKLDIPAGTVVKVEAEDDHIAGSYKVVYRLAPAYPRSWRLLLERESVATAPQVASAPEPEVAQASSSEGGLPNSDKIFAIKVSGLVGGGVRRSVVEYKVPFSRLSQEVKRITQMGGKIVSIAESNLLSTLE
ncbi:MULTISPECIES: phycobilisome linker polypeptide [unclassified Synechococcus]|jgi:phycocyanin-associated rod protein|uniref:phycobilisome linker polypeptide n=1 Tax=unclassified Synechococcus TaxID=2626047 RepID=UPI0002F0AD03|nr:phycobilisome linker polypeptide [Synechococcus sp. JA-2-3B'a(2-13)]MDT7945929.1 phycobilisome linker polypeptide [Cyanobacteriota bacterium PSP.bin.10]